MRILAPTAKEILSHLVVFFTFKLNTE